MDTSLKNRCLWLAVHRSKKHDTAYLLRQHCLLSLISCLFIPQSVSANPLIDSYVQFNEKLAYAILKPMREGMGVELESVNVDYHDQPVSFQYQMWRLRPNTVCLPQKNKLLEYSACTEAASQFFHETCQTLQQKPIRTTLYSNYKRLYCNAAVSYQPVVAKVRR